MVFRGAHKMVGSLIRDIGLALTANSFFEIMSNGVAVKSLLILFISIGILFYGIVIEKITKGQ